MTKPRSWLVAALGLLMLTALPLGISADTPSTTAVGINAALYPVFLPLILKNADLSRIPTATATATNTPVPTSTLTPTNSPTPEVTSTPGPLLYDDFSDDTSGWPADENARYTYGYEAGNYVIRFSAIGGYAWASPGFACDNCSIEVEAWRGEGSTGAYGILFGSGEGVTEGYLYIVDPGLRKYTVVLLGGGQGRLLFPYGWSAHINTYGDHNHLKVVRRGAEMDLYVNDQFLRTWTDDTYTGEKWVGLYGASVTVAQAANTSGMDSTTSSTGLLAAGVLEFPTERFEADSSRLAVSVRFDDFAVWEVGEQASLSR